MDGPELLAERLLRYGDEWRHEVERELHRTTQQQLIALGLDLREASREGPEEHRAALDRIADGIEEVLADLRVLSDRLYPASLSRGGLAPALRAYTRTLRVPVELDVESGEGSSAAVFYTVAEALAAAAAQPETTYIDARVARDGDSFRVLLRHDGAGMTIEQPLRDRVTALGGRIEIDAEATVTLEIPCAPER